MSSEDSRPQIGAIDIGTTGVRFVLYDVAARPIASSYRELPLSTPQPGWVEQDPEILWASTLTVLSDVLSTPPHQSNALAGIGLTNQRETVVAWDRETGRPLCPAIVWQDRRTSRRCVELRQQGLAQEIQERTGLSIDPYFSATKIEWLLENRPGLRAKAEAGTACFGTVDSWILFQLTGQHATDMTNASRTMLFNIDEMIWDRRLCALFNIPPRALPRVAPSLSVFGSVKSGLPAAGTPIAGILGDQQAALLGQGGVTSGQSQTTWGTGAFLLMNTGELRATSTSGLLTTVAQASLNRAPTYALEGSVFVAGAAVQWLRDVLGILPSSADSSSMACRVESTEGVVFVPALTGLGSPQWDPNARGLIIGISRGTRREHLIRATLEAIAYQTHDVIRAMERDTGTPVDELRVGGGAAANDFLCQFQSDILGVPVVRPKHNETTAQGAAFAAGVSVGVWPDLSAIEELWQADARFEPRMDAAPRRELLRDWQRAVQRAKGWCASPENDHSEDS